MEGEEIEGGHFGEVRRLRGVTNRGRRPPAREASVPAPQGPRKRAAEWLELLVRQKDRIAGQIKRQLLL